MLKKGSIYPPPTGPVPSIYIPHLLVTWIIRLTEVLVSFLMMDDRSTGIVFNT